MFRLAALKCIFFLQRYTSTNYIFSYNEHRRIIDPIGEESGILTSLIHVRVFRETNEVSASVSPAERVASAKIERSEVAVVRKV